MKRKKNNGFIIDYENNDDHDAEQSFDFISIYFCLLTISRFRAKWGGIV